MTFVEVEAPGTHTVQSPRKDPHADGCSVGLTPMGISNRTYAQAEGPQDPRSCGPLTQADPQDLCTCGEPVRPTLRLRSCRTKAEAEASHDPRPRGGAEAEQSHNLTFITKKI